MLRTVKLFFKGEGPVTEELTQTICKFECSCYNILGKHHLTAKCEGIVICQPITVHVLGGQIILPAYYIFATFISQVTLEVPH